MRETEPLPGQEALDALARELALSAEGNPILARIWDNEEDTVYDQQQPAPEGLRKAIGRTFWGYPEDDMDARLNAVIAAHISPLLAERDAALAELAKANHALSRRCDQVDALSSQCSDLQEALATIAAHIAPLLAERDALHRRCDQLEARADKYSAALAEAARLREALAVIAAHNGDRWEYDDDGLPTLRQPRVQEIARAALGLAPDGSTACGCLEPLCPKCLKG